VLECGWRTAGEKKKPKKTNEKTAWEEDSIPSVHLCRPSSGACIKKLVSLVSGWGRTLPAAYAEQAGKIAPSDLCCPNQTACNA